MSPTHIFMWRARQCFYLDLVNLSLWPSRWVGVCVGLSFLLCSDREWPAPRRALRTSGRWPLVGTVFLSTAQSVPMRALWDFHTSTWNARNLGVTSSQRKHLGLLWTSMLVISLCLHSSPHLDHSWDKKIDKAFIYAHERIGKSALRDPRFIVIPYSILCYCLYLVFAQLWFVFERASMTMKIMSVILTVVRVRVRDCLYANVEFPGF